MLLEAAVVVEVEGVLIVLVEVLPCAVVVDSEDFSGVVVGPDVFKKKILTTNVIKTSIRPCIIYFQFC